MRHAFPRNPEIVNGTFYFACKLNEVFNSKMYTDFINQDKELAYKIYFTRQRDGYIQVNITYGVSDEDKIRFYNKFIDKLDNYTPKSTSKSISKRNRNTTIGEQSSCESTDANSPSSTLEHNVIEQNTNTKIRDHRLLEGNSNLNKVEKKIYEIPDPFSINLFSDSSDSDSDKELDELEREILLEMRRMSLDLFPEDQPVIDNLQQINPEVSTSAEISTRSSDSESDSSQSSDEGFVSELESEDESQNSEQNDISSTSEPINISYNLFFTPDVEIKENTITLSINDPAMLRGIRDGLANTIKTIVLADPEFKELKMQKNIQKGKLVLSLPNDSLNFYYGKFLPQFHGRTFKYLKEQHKKYNFREKFTENTPVINNQITYVCESKFELVAIDSWMRNKKTTKVASDKLKGEKSLFSSIKFHREMKSLLFVITLPDIKDFYVKEFLPHLRSPKVTGKNRKQANKNASNTDNNAKVRSEANKKARKRKRKEPSSNEFASTRVHDYRNVFVERIVPENGFLSFDYDQAYYLSNLVHEKIRAKHLAELVSCHANEAGKLTLIIKAGTTSEEKTKFYNEIFRSKIIPKKHNRHIDFTKWFADESKLDQNFVTIKCDDPEEQHSVAKSLKRRIFEKVDLEKGLVKIFPLDDNEIVVKFNHKTKAERDTFFSDVFLPVICRIGNQSRNLDYSLLEEYKVDSSRKCIIVDIKNKHDARVFRTRANTVINQNQLKMKVEQRKTCLEFTIDADNIEHYYETFFLPIVEPVSSKRKRLNESSMNLDPQNNNNNDNTNNQHIQKDVKHEEPVKTLYKKDASDVSTLKTFGTFKFTEKEVAYATDTISNKKIDSNPDVGYESEDSLDLF